MWFRYNCLVSSVYYAPLKCVTHIHIGERTLLPNLILFICSVGSFLLFFSVPCTRLYKQSIRTVISFLCERIECFWKIYRTLSAMCSRLASFLLCLTHTDTQSMRWTVRYISAVYGWACVCIGSRPFVAVPHSDRSPAFTTITTASITVVYGTETCYRAATTAMPSISVGQPRLALPCLLHFTLLYTQKCILGSPRKPCHTYRWGLHINIRSAARTCICVMFPFAQHRSEARHI